MSRPILALSALLAILAGCSSSPADGGDPAASDDTVSTDNSGGGSGTETMMASTVGSGGSTGGGGGSTANGGAPQTGGAGKGGAAGAGHVDAGNASDAGSLGLVPTLPLPAPGTPGIDYLSDLTEEPGAINGWGPFEKDQTNGWTNANDGCKPIDLFAGAKYAKGIGAHAYSKITYKLGGAYRLFVSDIGFAFCETPGGTVVFQVFLDGAKAYDSGIFTKDSKRATTVNVDVTGKMKMDVVVTDGGDGIFGDHVAWAGARLVK
jgi:hypothetical protein